MHGEICEWETLPNLIPCRIHLACCCVVLLWRNCVLNKHEDDALIAWTITQIRSTICLWSAVVTGTVANWDDAENICVELYVSMRAGIAKHRLCWRYSESAHCKHAWDGKSIAWGPLRETSAPFRNSRFSKLIYYACHELHPWGGTVGVYAGEHLANCIYVGSLS